MNVAGCVRGKEVMLVCLLCDFMMHLHGKWQKLRHKRGSPEVHNEG